jgi:hypothetical protein
LAIKYYITGNKYSLKAPVDVSALDVSSAAFKYINPSGGTGTFVATVDGANDQIYYNIGSSDITIVGKWQIWAEFTDSGALVIRGDTTEIEFFDNTK